MARPVILEPIYKINITVPPELVGSAASVVTQRRGSIESIDDRGRIALISGYIPVAETIGFASVMRSATAGRAFWQLQFSHWSPLPEKLAEKVVMDIRKRKGLPLRIPEAKEFMDEL